MGFKFKVYYFLLMSCSFNTTFNRIDHENLEVEKPKIKYDVYGKDTYCIRGDKRSLVVSCCK